MSTNIINLDANPFAPYGWDVVEHRRAGMLLWNVSLLSLHLEVEQQNGKWIKGDLLYERLRSKRVWNANVLDHWLRHPGCIPEECRGKWVFFWGTIYRNRFGEHYVRCLDWSLGHRTSYGFFLGHGWSENDPAASPSL